METATQPILEVRDLAVEFGSAQGRLRAVDGVSFSIGERETVALVGESGCGKSVTALSLARLLPPSSVRYPHGTITLLGQDVLKHDETAMRTLRGRDIGYIFQDPGSSLNPVMQVGEQILEALQLHAPDRAKESEVVNLLDMVGITRVQRVMLGYPFQLSGGMQQRVAIAMAIASRPRLLVADEPTTALDVTVQDQVIKLLISLQNRLGMSILLITHNLGLVAGIAQRVCVMYAGHIVEEGPTQDILLSPRHPYTRALLDAVPRMDGRRATLKGIDGFVPTLADMPAGCRFHPRCPRAGSICASQDPGLTTDGARRVACHFPL